MPLLSVIKVITQGKYSKKNVKSFSDVLLYNTLAFFFSALVLAVIFLRHVPTLEVVLFSLASAIASTLFQVFYTITLKNGPIAITSIMVSFNIVLTLIAGAVFFNEKWSIFTIIGFIFMACAFYLMPARKDDKKSNLKWLILVVCTMLFSGLYGVVMLFFSKSAFACFQGEYVVLTFSFASLICFILTLFTKRKEPITIKFNWVLPLIGIIIGGTLGLYNLLNVVALKNYDSYVAVPIINGTTIFLSMAVNSIIDREKPTVKMIIGVVCAIVAIVLLNF